MKNIDTSKIWKFWKCWYRTIINFRALPVTHLHHSLIISPVKIRLWAFPLLFLILTATLKPPVDVFYSAFYFSLFKSPTLKTTLKNFSLEDILQPGLGLKKASVRAGLGLFVRDRFSRANRSNATWENPNPWI